MRAAVYVRLSELTDSTTSPERQRADCLKWVEAHGHQFDPTVDLYEDIDVSAYTGVRRPAYQQMLERLADYDVVVCWKLDRLLRSVRRDLGPLLEQLDEHDVRLHSIQEGLDNTSPGGEFVITVMAALAQSESATTGLRIRSSQDHLARTGRWRGGKVPYGWQPADHPDGGRRLVLDPATAPTVLRIVELLEQGRSGRAVAETLNTEGVLSWGGKLWSGQQIYLMVRNPRMAGWQSAGGAVLRDADGQPVAGPEPLIDDGRWQRLVASLSNVGWNRTRRKGATMLSGLVRCGGCGGPMVGWTSDSPKASYACSRRADHGPSHCPGSTILTRWADQYVGQAVLDAADRYWHLLPEPAPSEPDRTVAEVDRLVAQLRRLERDRTELGLYDDPESEQVYVSRWRDLRGRIAQGRRAVQDRAERDARPSPADVATGPLRGSWPFLDTDRRRRVVSAFVDHVVVRPVRPGWRGKWDPERVEIVWLPV